MRLCRSRQRIIRLFRRVGAFAFATCFLVGCQGGQRTPSAPSDAGPTASSAADSVTPQQVAAQWSPYVGVHVDGLALPAYRDALSALQRAGRVEGARMEIHRNEAVNPVIKAVGAMGVEVLGLVSNDNLFEPDIERVIDRIFSAYPEIRYFQIGNEVTTILPPTGPTITIEQYAVLFNRIYEHVQSRYPGRAVLVTQSALGSGLRGPTELETLTDLALVHMDPDKVIVAINAYDPDAVSQYRGLLSGSLRAFRVWVTESGVANPSLHATFVRDRYPLLRMYLRAERVYWYVLWGGDSGSDADFSLIRYPSRYPDYWKSPLFGLLASP
jgi:hypothetical protein